MQLLRLLGFRAAGLTAIATMLLIGSGCQKSRKIVQKPVIPVKGTFLVNGKPAAGAIVSFHPAGERRGLTSSGVAGPDGTVKLTTYLKEDGAPVGDYIVTVYWAGVPTKAVVRDAVDEDEDEADNLPPDRLGGRFANTGKSNLRARVEGEAVEFAPIDLSSPDVSRGQEFRLSTI